MSQESTLALLRDAAKPLRAIDVTKLASEKAKHAVSGGLIARDLKKLKEHGLAVQFSDKTWKAVDSVGAALADAAAKTMAEVEGTPVKGAPNNILHLDKKEVKPIGSAPEAEDDDFGDGEVVDGVRYYDISALNPKGVKEDPTRCRAAVPAGIHRCQCSRPRGQGPGGLYCKTHGKKRFDRLEERRKAAKPAEGASLVLPDGATVTKSTGRQGAKVTTYLSPAAAKVMAAKPSKRPTHDAQGHRIDGKRCDKCSTPPPAGMGPREEEVA
jgi:hypothetical protein